MQFTLVKALPSHIQRFLVAYVMLLHWAIRTNLMLELYLVFTGYLFSKKGYKVHSLKSQETLSLQGCYLSWKHVPFSTITNIPHQTPFIDSSAPFSDDPVPILRTILLILILMVITLITMMPICTSVPILSSTPLKSWEERTSHPFGREIIFLICAM